MEELGRRRGELQDMQPDGKGRVRLDYRITARGLIGFQGEFMTLTRGTGIMSHVFDEYGPLKAELEEHRNGVLVSQDDGEAVAYALWKLQERGRMFVSPGDPVYEGMIIGIHSRDNDLVVNPIRTKQLTNIRASGKDEAILLTPPIALHAGIRGGVHRRRRARGDHAEVDPPAQAPPAGARAPARGPRRSLALIPQGADALEDALAEAVVRRGIAAQRVADQAVQRVAVAQPRVGGDLVERGLHLRGLELPVEQQGNLERHRYHLLPRAAPRTGSSLCAMNSRARKMRVRTVPIGVPSICAISR